MEYPGGRITTKPTPANPAVAMIHEKMNPPRRPLKTQNSLAKAMERYG